jgi:hypothetical protein
MQHCRQVWKAKTGQEVLTTAQEQKLGKSTGNAAMSTICSELQMFVAAAKAAGSNLTYDTWTKALNGVGQISMAAAPIASFAPNKPDGQDSFQLQQFNPAFKPNSGIQQFLPIGPQITFTG